MCGTPSYIAPEMLREEPYDFKADIFSIGSIMFNLLTGMYLFPGDEVEVILKNNKECNLSKTKRHIVAASD